MTVRQAIEPAGKSAAHPDDAQSRQSVVDEFHRLYYGDKQRTWMNTRWLGVQVFKCPLDLWIYQELLYELRPDVIIEAGTFAGGSSLFLASMCDLIGHGRVYTVDVAPRPELPIHPRVEYLTGSSTSDEVRTFFESHIREGESVLVFLDSNHSREHVLRELQTYSQFVTRGSYIVLEDTNVNGHPVAPNHGPGPMEALNEFLAARGSEFQIDETREKFFLTFNPRGYLRFIGRPPVRTTRAKAAVASTAGAKSREYPYRTEFDPTRDNPKSRAVRLVGPHKHVLDLGCGPGILAKPLVDQGCTVTGVEADPTAAREAEAVCERVIVADLEDPTWMGELGSAQFDVITANSVLEHLETPVETLRHVRRFIKPGGYVVASIPNVAHGSLRLALLAGEFEYRDLGLLDRTHLRFFTRRSIEDLFGDAGYVIRNIERFEKPIEATEIPVPKDTPPELLESLSADEEARTYVFVVTASPIRHGSEKELRERLRAVITENDELRKQLSALARPIDLESREETALTPDAAKRRVTELRATAADLRRQIADRQKQIEAMQSELLAKYRSPSASETALAARDQEIAALKDAVRVRTNEAERAGASLRQILAGREAEIAELRAHLQAAETRRNVRDDSSEHANDARVRDLEQELDRIHTSRLWRVASWYWRLRHALGLRDRRGR